jgi:hypothetical protein
MAEDKKRPERRHLTPEEMGKKPKVRLEDFDNQHRDDGKPAQNNGQRSTRR